MERISQESKLSKEYLGYLATKRATAIFVYISSSLHSWRYCLLHPIPIAAIPFAAPPFELCANSPASYAGYISSSARIRCLT